jgi:hypothetical protein
MGIQAPCHTRVTSRIIQWRSDPLAPHSKEDDNANTELTGVSFGRITTRNDNPI